MVKIVRMFLALFATLWYTTPQLNSSAPFYIDGFKIPTIIGDSNDTTHCAQFQVVAICFIDRN